MVRARLEQSLAVAQQGGHRLAVLFIDIDHFQTINGGLGHAVGDALLVAVAQRLQAQMRSHDILGRQSGDEFVVVLHDMENVRGADEFVRQLIEVFLRHSACQRSASCSCRLASALRSTQSMAVMLRS
ncbi:diguanylate cyclase domain-containing protein [Cupriavidus sp. BIC8F]|uniref:diguanylate cyclase domain-containing protein n=1 Tax=Cupriavidus sp. BIC8F TaxID=3079014 RepID=UPI0039679419